MVYTERPGLRMYVLYILRYMVLWYVCVRLFSGWDTLMDGNLGCFTVVMNFPPFPCRVHILRAYVQYYIVYRPWIDFLVPAKYSAEQLRPVRYWSLWGWFTSIAVLQLYTIQYSTYICTYILALNLRAVICTILYCMERLRR